MGLALDLNFIFNKSGEHYGPTPSWAYADTHPYPYPYPYPYPMYGYGYMDMDMDMDMGVYPHRPNLELARNAPQTCLNYIL